jgi:hypothetical protein
MAGLGGLHGGELGHALGTEGEKRTRERGDRGERGGRQGPYPLVQRVGSGHLLARSTAGALPGSCLPPLRRRTTVEVGQPLLGHRLGEERERVGLENGPEQRREFFPFKVFSISAFQTKLLF